MTIDWWTLGIQTVNVVVLIWLLRRFFWRPVAAMIAKRTEATKQALASAKATEDKATAALTAIATTRAGFAAERAAILATARTEADAATTASLDGAAKDVASRQVVATAALQRERADAEAEWSTQADSLALDIAGRLVARLDGAEVRATFLEWLLAGIRGLPDAARHETATESGGLHAVTPAALSTADQARYRALISEAFGSEPPIAFSADDTLIAGIELHGPHFVVANSWKADLGRIRAELARAT